MPVDEYLCQNCGMSHRLKAGVLYETDFKGKQKKNLATTDNHCPGKDTKSGCGSCAATSD
ncbi:hypothetical protein E1189_03945 [Sansalvadorimonas verongulae]|nr:hypothetical protein [Sansalvadorimonas verongulae]